MAMNELEKFLRADYEKWKDNEYLHEMVDGKYVGITFGEFIEKVNYLGTYLVSNGYKDKNIGIYSPNSLAWMIADVAIMNYVGLSVGLNKDWKDDNLDYAIGKCEIVMPSSHLILCCPHLLQPPIPPSIWKRPESFPMSQLFA